MKIYSTYSVKILGRNRIFRETAAAYRSAVDFFIGISLKEWGSISRLKGLRRNNEVEKYTIKTKKRPEVPYDFSKDFYKFPSYLRRAAIAEALGKCSSYMSSLERYEESGEGSRPGYPRPFTGTILMCALMTGQPGSKSISGTHGTGSR